MGNLKGLKGHSATVGVHGKAEPYQKGQEGPVAQAQVYAVHEFGSRDGKIPERATMRPTVDAQREKYLKMMQMAIDAAHDGTPLEVGLGRLGLAAATDIQGAIVALQTPELAESTIRKKKKRAGSTLRRKKSQQLKAGTDADGNEIDTGNPLVDTKQMLGSITWEVQ